MGTPITVSENVKLALSTAFPNVNMEDVAWSWEVYNKIVEAEFFVDGVKHEVEITVTGHHLLTEKELTVADVPANVVDAVKANYADFSINEAELVTWSTGEVFYELDLSNANGEEETEIHVCEKGEITAVGEDL